MSSPFHADMQNVLVRMVVPMRREFGCALDVQQMRRDRAYAESIVTQALTSRVESLRDCARLIGHHLSAAQTAPKAQRPAAGRSVTSQADAVQHDAALAARRLIDLVGPMAEALAIRIERAPDAQALEKLIGDARACIAGVRGEAAASDYAQQIARSAANKPQAAPSARGSGGATLRRSARFAARELVALIGPSGQGLAERIERAPDLQTLDALIDEAREGITAVIGAPAADEFVHRVT